MLLDVWLACLALGNAEATVSLTIQNCALHNNEAESSEDKTSRATLQYKLTTECLFLTDRLMTPESEIRFVHKQMGLVPGWGGAARLVQILGSSPALRLLSGAVKVQPEQALHIGLIDTILSPPNEPLEEACAWLKLHTKGPAEVIQAVKKVVVAGRELQLEAALRTEMKIFGTVWGGPANLEALTQRTKHKRAILKMSLIFCKQTAANHGCMGNIFFKKISSLGVNIQSFPGKGMLLQIISEGDWFLEILQ